MRLGVLDIGSNTGHLLVVDAHSGAAPMPASSYKEPLRLAEHLDAAGAITPEGVERLCGFVAQALSLAEDKGCEEVYSFATSAIRESANGEDALRQVQDSTGVDIAVLPGEAEARLTFLAARRWFGWSAGRLAVFDIGGGSLEVAAGADEAPEHAFSLPLGAGRLTRDWFGPDGHGGGTVRELRRHIRTELARAAGSVLRGGSPDRAVATSKTFRSLARICGAPSSDQGAFVRRSLRAEDLDRRIPDLVAMSREELSGLPGVSSSRAHQMPAGALVASACMDILEVEELEICPWALREGVILERFDKMSALG